MFFFISISTLIIGYISSYNLSKKIHVDLKVFNVFFIIKFLYVLIFIYFNIFSSFGTDSKSFYINSNNYSFSTLPVGDNLIYGINLFLSKYFQLDFLSVNTIIFFPIIWSTILLLSVIEKLERNFEKLIFYFLLILPSLNFWTSGLNKDMLTYCALSFLIFNIIHKKNSLILLSLFFIFLIRPYILFFLLVSIIMVGIIYLLYNINFYKKKFNLLIITSSIFLIFFSIIIIYLIAGNLMGSFGRYFLSGDIFAILESLQRHYYNTPLGIPIETNSINRFFIYFFYPFPWTGLTNDLFYIVMILENVFLIFISLITFCNKKIFYFNNWYFITGILAFILLGLIMSQVTSNVGIAFRQKWMIIPFLLILISSKNKKIT